MGGVIYSKFIFQKCGPSETVFSQRQHEHNNPRINADWFRSFTLKIMCARHRESSSLASDGIPRIMILSTVVLTTALLIINQYGITIVLLPLPRPKNLKRSSNFCSWCQHEIFVCKLSCVYRVRSNMGFLEGKLFV